MTRMRLHFISGLPRSGSTMLGAILRQNPQVRASMSGPVFQMFVGLRNSMGPSNEFAFRITDKQRECTLRGMVEAFYGETAPGEILFDTNRGWCSMLPALTKVFPDAKVICCVRSLAWILDSFERVVQNNGLRNSKMFQGDREETAANVHDRVELLMKRQVGGSLNGLRQAWFGESADRLIAIRYESITANPASVMSKLYESIGEEPFAHDFDSLQYDEPQFDETLGMPGLHTVRARVEAVERKTILPPDLFAQHNRSFWDMPGQNPRHVLLL